MKSFAIALVFLTFLVCFLAAAAGPAGEPLQSNPLAGRAVFVAKGCVNCHSLWGKGEAIGPDLGRAGSGMTMLELAATLWSHSPKMVEQMKEKRVQREPINEEEMSALSSFLYYLSFLDESGDPRMGREVVTSKGCLNCHSLSGKGGHSASSFDKFSGGLSSIALVQAMWSAAPEMAAEMKRMGLTWPRFEGTDLSHILAYIRAAMGKKPQRGSLLRPGNPLRGSDLFKEKRCEPCHTQDSLFGKLRTKNLPEMGAGLWSRTPAMQAMMKERGIPTPKLDAEDLADILSYVAFAGYRDPPGNPANGRKLFSDKKCIACHSVGGEGGNVGPDLAEWGVASSESKWTSLMWNHASAMEAQFEERGISWPQFGADEMRDLFSYVSYAKGKRGAGK